MDLDDDEVVIAYIKAQTPDGTFREGFKRILEVYQGYVGCRKDTRQLYLDSWLDEVRKRFKFAGNNSLINYCKGGEGNGK